MSTAPHFVASHEPPSRPRDSALLFLARGMDLLVQEREGAVSIPTGAAFPELATGAHFLGVLDGVDCYAAPLPSDFTAPEGMKVVPARSRMGARTTDHRFPRTNGPRPPRDRPRAASGVGG